MFPTAIHVAVGQAISKELLPALKRFYDVLEAKAKQWDHIIKIGRTHLRMRRRSGSARSSAATRGSWICRSGGRSWRWRRS